MSEIPESLQEQLDATQKFLSPTIMELHKSVQESLNLTDFNISEQAMVASTIHHSYLTLLYQHKALKKKLEEALDQKEEQYVNRYAKAGIPKYKTESEFKALAQTKLLRTKIDDETEIISYLYDVCKILKQHGFNIKNICDLMKLDNV